MSLFSFVSVIMLLGRRGVLPFALSVMATIFDLVADIDDFVDVIAD